MGGPLDLAAAALVREAAIDASVVSAGHRVHPAAVALVVVFAIFTALIPSLVVAVVVVDSAQRIVHRRARRDEVSVDVEPDALRDDAVVDGRELFGAQRLQRLQRIVVVVVVVVGKAATEAHVRKLVRLVSQAAKAAPVVERGVLGNGELRKLRRVVVKRQVAHRKVVRLGGGMCLD